MKITGELLKSERLKKNLTVNDVASALKLSSKMINSIEAGQTEALPAKTFVRGFVKSYAQYLKLDVNQVMSQFQEEMGSTHPMPKSPPPVSAEPTAKTVEVIEKKKEVQKEAQNEATKIIKNEKNNKSYAYIGVAVVLVVLIVAINRVVDRYQKETVLDQQEISKLEPLAQQAASVDSVTTKTSADATATPATTTATLSADVTSQTTQTAVAASIDATIPVTTTNAIAGEGFDPSNGKPVEIIIEAKKDFELSYARGNSTAFSKVKLTSKQIQVIRSPNGLYLKSEDGGAFHLVVNGIDKGAAGASNKPVKLSF